MHLADEIYLLSHRLPTAERFGLQARLRRSAVSVVANIAEAGDRLTLREYRFFLGVASASLRELGELMDGAAPLLPLGDDRLRRARRLVDDIAEELWSLDPSTPEASLTAWLSDAKFRG